MAQTIDKIATTHNIQSVNHDPDAATATLLTADGGTTTTYLDMREYSKIAAIVAPHTIAGNGVTLVEIVSSDDNSAAGSNLVQIATSGAVQADAQGDYVFIEATEEQIRQEVEDDATATLGRYATIRITNADATDEDSVTLIGIAKHPEDGLTATAIA